MLAMQMLVILITIPRLTIDSGVRESFTKLINDKCQNNFYARGSGFKHQLCQAIGQKYCHPIKNIYHLFYRMIKNH
jgi:deoxyhypusine synthase